MPRVTTAPSGSPALTLSSLDVALTISGIVNRPDGWPDTDAIRYWLELVVEIIGLGIPITLIAFAFVSGEPLESIIWIGIMGFVLGMIFMYGTTPQKFGLFPPRRQRPPRD